MPVLGPKTSDALQMVFAGAKDYTSWAAAATTCFNPVTADCQVSKQLLVTW
jgi:hypothetical protein